MNEHAESGVSLLAKIAGIWAVIGITSWSEAASFAAFCLTMYLLVHHIYRDLLRPFLESFGIVKPRKPHHAQRKPDDMKGGAEWP